MTHSRDRETAAVRLTPICLLVLVAASLQVVPSSSDPRSDAGIITVHVVGKDGRAIPGVRVSLIPEKRGGLQLTATTDAEGRAAFNGLTLGAGYVVRTDPSLGMRTEALVRAGKASDPPQELHLWHLRSGVAIAPRNATPDEELVAEVVFRSLIRGSGSAPARGVYALTLLGQDPSPDLLARLSEGKIRAKKGTEFQSGDRGSRCSIDYIGWLDEHTAEAGATDSGTIYTFIVAKEGAGWKVRSRSIDVEF